MVRLNLNSCTSVTEVPRQAGRPPGPRDGKSINTREIQSKGGILSSWMVRKGQRCRGEAGGGGRGGQILGPALQRMGEIFISGGTRGGQNEIVPVRSREKGEPETLSWRTKQGGQRPEPMQRLASKKGGKRRLEPYYEALRTVQSLLLKPSLRRFWVLTVKELRQEMYAQHDFPYSLISECLIEFASTALPNFLTAQRK